MTKMKNLIDCTFIIPVKIEHEDRYQNSKSVLGFLNHHFRTNVIIYEISEDGNSRLDFLDDLKNLKVEHFTELLPKEGAFHRTRYLNIMLDKVKTPVVVNYDIDVFLPPESYLICRDRIVKGEVDVYYPYGFGSSQYQVFQSVDRSRFHIDFTPESILSGISSDGKIRRYGSEYGHCIFFNTEVYREFGGENEEFISYGPEDKERGLRFRACNKKVEWLDGVVFHFEHHRGNDSSLSNPYIQSNNNLFSQIQSLVSSGGILDYYRERPYYEKYTTIGKGRENWSSSMTISRNLGPPVTEVNVSVSNPLRL